MSPRRNWDSPNLSLTSECAPPPTTGGGGAHCGWGVGESQFRRLEKGLVLCLLSAQILPNLICPWSPPHLLFISFSFAFILFSFSCDLDGLYLYVVETVLKVLILSPRWRAKPSGGFFSTGGGLNPPPPPPTSLTRYLAWNNFFLSLYFLQMECTFIQRTSPYIQRPPRPSPRGGPDSNPGLALHFNM